MKHVVIRWVCLLSAMFVFGPAAGALAGSLRAPDGGPAATAFLSESLPQGLLFTLAVIGLGAVIGVIGAKLATARVGLFCAGLVIAWGAFSSGQLDQVLRRTQSGATYWTLAIEGLVLGAAALAAAWVILRVSGQREESRVNRRDSGQMLAGFVATIAVGGFVAWVVARSELVGQTVAAAIAAGAVGTMVGRVVGHPAPMIVFVAAGLVLGVIGPMSGALVDGAHAVERLYAGNAFALARVMPLDWLGGVLMGVPVGSWWASSMVEKHAPAAATGAKG